MHRLSMSATSTDVRGNSKPGEAESILVSMRRYERRQWALSFTGVLVALLLTLGIVSFYLSVLVPQLNSLDSFSIGTAVHALVGLVLLFDVYVIYQQLQIHRFRMRLAEREELFRLITENAADMIAVVTSGGHRLYNSPSYQRVLGYSPEELGKTTAYDQIHPDDQQAVASAAEEARRTGVGRRLEYRIRHKNGEWRALESTSSAVRNASGEIEKLVIVNRDITERKQLEQQLYLSQKLEAVGRLSGGIAHDFNNLLGVIIGYSEAMQRRMGQDHAFREPVDEILKAGQRAAALTQQLLAFSRKQVLELKILDLNTVVGDVQKMLHRLIGEDIELKINLSSELELVKADPGQMTQVIMNLAVNARDAMPRGGTLTIETSNAQLNETHSKRYGMLCPGNTSCCECAIRDAAWMRKHSLTSLNLSLPPRSWGKGRDWAWRRFMASSNRVAVTFGLRASVKKALNLRFIFPASRESSSTPGRATAGQSSPWDSEASCLWKTRSPCGS